MKKLLSVIAVTLIAAGSLHAQDKTVSSKPVSFSIGLDAGVPIGIAGDVYSFIIGGSLQGEYMAASDLGITLSAGYKSWSVKKDLQTTVGSNNFSFIPVLAGIKYYFTPVVYGSGQLGVTFSTESGGGSSFTYAPGVGFKVSKNVDVLAKYTGLSPKGGGSLNEVGVRLAYNF
ncbi:MAG: outer membrane beta-barrel protein [Ginsengibacter sp.]